MAVSQEALSAELILPRGPPQGRAKLHSQSSEWTFWGLATSLLEDVKWSGWASSWPRARARWEGWGHDYKGPRKTSSDNGRVNSPYHCDGLMSICLQLTLNMCSLLHTHYISVKLFLKKTWTRGNFLDLLDDQKINKIIASRSGKTVRKLATLPLEECIDIILSGIHFCSIHWKAFLFFGQEKIS